MAQQPASVLVTGGSRGIGAAIALELARRGHDVAVTYAKDAAAATSVRRRCEEFGVRALEARFDLRRPETAEEVTDVVCGRLGGLRTLILNAGTWAGGRLEEMESRLWWSVLETNLQGNCALVRAALPALKAAEGASIVFVSSVVGLQGFAGDTAYASSKAAMVGFARSLAKEVARDDIRVNVLAPGFVETDMTAAVGEQARESISRRLVLRRFGDADEVARAAAFLALDATYCTGIVLPVDGGWTL